MNRAEYQEILERVIEDLSAMRLNVVAIQVCFLLIPACVLFCVVLINFIRKRKSSSSVPRIRVHEMIIYALLVVVSVYVTVVSYSSYTDKISACKKDITESAYCEYEGEFEVDRIHYHRIFLPDDEKNTWFTVECEDDLRLKIMNWFQEGVFGEEYGDYSGTIFYGANSNFIVKIDAIEAEEEDPNALFIPQEWMDWYYMEEQMKENASS